MDIMSYIDIRIFSYNDIWIKSKLTVSTNTSNIFCRTGFYFLYVLYNKIDIFIENKNDK